MRALPPLRAGVYRHYKGHYYQVFGYAHDANTTESFYKSDDGTDQGMRVVVVYMALQLDDAHTGPRLAVRTVDDFYDYVDPSDGSRVPEAVVEACKGNTRDVLASGYVPRFEYHGPQWRGAGKGL